MMILFNLIPIYPLDGNRVISLFLSKIYDDEYCYRLLSIISLIFLVFLIIYFIMFKSFASLIIIVFLSIKQVEYYKVTKMKVFKHKILLTYYFKK